MGFLFGFLVFVAFCAAVVKVIEAATQGSAHNIPFSRMFNSRWAVTTRESGYTNEQGVYVFRGRWFAPTEFVRVNMSRDSLEAAKLVAKYANDNGLRGLPDLNRSRTLPTPAAVYEYVEEWHRAGGGKGGRVIEV